MSAIRRSRRNGLEWMALELVPQPIAAIERTVRQDGLGDLEPPAWCIEMEKWPYNTPDWKQWLTDKRADRSRRFPQIQSNCPFRLVQEMSGIRLNSDVHCRDLEWPLNVDLR